MFSINKKYCVFTICIFLILLISNGIAFSVLIPIDGRDDAGIYPGQAAFAEFVIGANPHVQVDPTYPKWLDRTDVDAYVINYNASHPNSIPYWDRVQSAGNIWSSDTSVGDSYIIPSAGTYRISPFDGAFRYDNFGWGGNAYKYWWKVYIKATKVYHDGQLEAQHGYILGLDGMNNFDLETLDDTNAAYNRYADLSGTSILTDYDNPLDAFNAVKDCYIDIPMAKGGELSFWIWDWNSIDNSGSITVNVASVPEPSTFLLLTIGIALLIRRTRS